MGVMNEAVEDSVGIGWITDDIVPAVDGKLACDDGGAAAIALLKDFQKILPCLGIDWPVKWRCRNGRPYPHRCG